MIKKTADLLLKQCLCEACKSIATVVVGAAIAQKARRNTRNGVKKLLFIGAPCCRQAF
jgi:hypothetical protein